MVGVKSWFKKVKCPVCQEKKDSLSNELRLDTSEGILQLFVCNECADFFDKSAEVLAKRNPAEDEEDAADSI
jgi:hypothetical protein